MAKQAFNQYIDALSDLKMVVEGVTDLYKKPEFLFMGPDENTADLMDSAAY
jgi:glutamate dehydrogenase